MTIFTDRRARITKPKVTLFGALALTLLSSSAAHALTINFTYDPSVAAQFSAADVSAIKSDLAIVDSAFSGYFTNPLTLNFGIEASAKVGTLAYSSSAYTGNGTPFSYATIRTALIAHASTPKSLAAANAIPVNEPGTAKGHGYFLTTPEAQALGLRAADPTLQDGTMGLGSNIGGGQTWDFNGTSTPGASQYSFVDAAEHEISEMMGRTTQLTNTGFPYNEPIDLLRYTAPGVIDMSAGAIGAYFSVDGGVTVAKYYNGPNANGADIQDWATSANPDPYDAYGSPGQYLSLSAVDQEVMNVLGWTSPAAVTPSVPEPTTWAMALVGFGMIGFAARRRQNVSVSYA